VAQVCLASTRAWVQTLNINPPKHREMLNLAFILLALCRWGHRDPCPSSLYNLAHLDHFSPEVPKEHLSSCAGLGWLYPDPHSGLWGHAHQCPFYSMEHPWFQSPVGKKHLSQKQGHPRHPYTRGCAHSAVPISSALLAGLPWLFLFYIFG
jgi:hypothetical protein